jgi:rubredoxin
VILNKVKNLLHEFGSLNSRRCEILVSYGGIIMEKWKCVVCGYIYDPEAGDPDGGVNPGTPFEQLPDEWTCPVCGAAKDMFEKV